MCFVIPCSFSVLKGTNCFRLTQHVTAFPLATITMKLGIVSIIFIQRKMERFNFSNFLSIDTLIGSMHNIFFLRYIGCFTTMIFKKNFLLLLFEAFKIFETSCIRLKKWTSNYHSIWIAWNLKRILRKMIFKIPWKIIRDNYCFVFLSLEII